MDDKLFERYQRAISHLEYVIWKSSLDEVKELLDYDIKNWEEEETEE